jgi:hypothetical protein
VTTVIACTGGSDASEPDAFPPPTPSGTPANPPPPLPPGTGSGGSSAGVGFPTLEGCPSTRPDESPITPLTEADVRGAVGIYRSCNENRGLEIRIHDETGELLWYRLDDRFVRFPSDRGSLEVIACDGHSCTVNFTHRGLGPVAHQLDLWRDPTSLVLLAEGETYAQEWMRVAD